MAFRKISELSSSLTPSGSGIIPIVINGTTFGTTLDAIKDQINSVLTPQYASSSITSSVDTLIGNVSSLNTFTSSADSRLDSLEIFTGSLNDYYATDQELLELREYFNTYSSSNNTVNTQQNIRLDALDGLEIATGSLLTQIETEKGRIDAILLSSDADKDSFKEIVDLINSVDTENDNAFGTYVLNTNDRIDSLEIESGSSSSRLNKIESVSGSWITIGDLPPQPTPNPTQSPVDLSPIVGRLDKLEIESGSIRDEFNSFTSSYLIVSQSFNDRISTLEGYHIPEPTSTPTATPNPTPLPDPTPTSTVAPPSPTSTPEPDPTPYPTATPNATPNPTPTSTPINYYLRTNYSSNMGSTRMYTDPNSPVTSFGESYGTTEGESLSTMVYLHLGLGSDNLDYTVTVNGNPYNNGDTIDGVDGPITISPAWDGIPGSSNRIFGIYSYVFNPINKVYNIDVTVVPLPTSTPVPTSTPNATPNPTPLPDPTPTSTVAPPSPTSTSTPETDYTQFDYFLTWRRNPVANGMTYDFTRLDGNTNDYFYSNEQIKCVYETFGNGGGNFWNIAVGDNSEGLISVGDNSWNNVSLFDHNVLSSFNNTTRSVWNDANDRMGNGPQHYIITFVSGEVTNLVSFDSIGDVSGCTPYTDPAPTSTPNSTPNPTATVAPPSPTSTVAPTGDTTTVNISTLQDFTPSLTGLTLWYTEVSQSYSLTQNQYDDTLNWIEVGTYNPIADCSQGNGPSNPLSITVSTPFDGITNFVYLITQYRDSNGTVIYGSRYGSMCNWNWQQEYHLRFGLQRGISGNTVHNRQDSIYPDTLSIVTPTSTPNATPNPTPTSTVAPTPNPTPNPTPTSTSSIQDIYLTLYINNDGGVNPWTGGATYSEVRDHLCTYGATSSNGTTRQTDGDPDNPQTGDRFYAGGFPLEPFGRKFLKSNPIHSADIATWRWIDVDNDGYITVSGFTCNTPTSTPNATPNPTPTSTVAPPSPTSTVAPVSCISAAPLNINVESEYDSNSNTTTFKYITSDLDGNGGLFGCINVDRGSTVTINVTGSAPNLETHPIKITNINNQGWHEAPLANVVSTWNAGDPYTLTWEVPCDMGITQYQYQCVNHASMRGVINVSGTCPTPTPSPTSTIAPTPTVNNDNSNSIYVHIPNQPTATPAQQ